MQVRISRVGIAPPRLGGGDEVKDALHAPSTAFLDVDVKALNQMPTAQGDSTHSPYVGVEASHPFGVF